MLKRKFSKVVSVVLTLAMISVLLISSAPVPAEAAGTTYYVDSVGGNDANNGTSTSSAWKTLGKVNQKTFQPGDIIKFKSGSTWSGQLFPKGSGTSTNVIKIDKYGTGNKPVINAGGSYTSAVYFENQEYWEINNLEITNSGNTTNRNTGILIKNTGVGKKSHLYVKNCYVHDVDGLVQGQAGSKKCFGGITYFVDNDGGVQSYWDDILIEGNTISNVDRAGIYLHSEWFERNGYVGDYDESEWVPSTNVRIRNNTLTNIGGDGIVVGSCDGALVEYNVGNTCGTSQYAYHVGMWMWSSDNCVFQYNEVFNQQMGDGDSEAWDFDFNCQGDIYQYNYSHDNAGGCLLVCSGPAYTKDHIFRYNISESENGYGIFNMSGANTTNVKIYNNTIYNDVSGLAVVKDHDWEGLPGSDMYFYNNIFYNQGVGSYSSRYTYDNNCYYLGSSPTDSHKITSNPMLVNPGNGGENINFTDANRLAGYKLQSGSPCINTGKSISSNGGKDFWGNSLYNGNPDIGAHEFSGSGATPSPTPTSTPTPVNIKVEAENMTMTNYAQETKSGASGGKVIKLTSEGVTGNATYTFTGTAGTYNITVCYFDENDGQCPFKLYVGSTQVDSWTATADDNTYKTRTKSGVSLSNVSVIKVEGTYNVGEWARVDYIEIKN